MLAYIGGPKDYLILGTFKTPQITCTLMRRLDHCESYHVQESMGILKARARHDGLPLLKEHRHGDGSDTSQR